MRHTTSGIDTWPELVVDARHIDASRLYLPQAHQVSNRYRRLGIELAQAVIDEDAILSEYRYTVLGNTQDK